MQERLTSKTVTGTDSSAGVRAPLTGREFLDSLQDGREVWIYGERVQDVTVHPAFRNSARMLARMYEALHHPEKSGRIVT